ncbi:4,5:9,10-diseco-3-hydroxy-5,9, 17-trioxoandrosta-1(10),2-diene-4-oate hydrolase [Thermoflexales bacterium]|nr:4,5:9,10-diseco-3-hydroxy-5,9, 17-trioxoandrosta-1(10),2-diene-4-oate hydrolase [Thermoflexales bacterium]
MSITSHWVTVQGLKIHYLAAGETGSPVVLLHGAGVDSASLSWRLTLEPLAETHRVFAPDLPGYGQSAKPDVQYNTDFYIDFMIQFLDALQLQKVSLVGLSMGGAIALGLTLRCPDRVERLVPVDAYGLMPKVAWHKLSYLYVITPLNEWSYWFFKRSKSMVRWSLLSSLISSPDRLSEELVNEVYQAAQDPSAGKAFASYQRFDLDWQGLRTNYLDRLHEIVVPTLFVNGEKDAGVPVKYVQQAHDLVKDSRLYIMPECKHWPQRDKTEEFNRVVKDFLDA